MSSTRTAFNEHFSQSRNVQFAASRLEHPSGRVQVERWGLLVVPSVVQVIQRVRLLSRTRFPQVGRCLIMTLQEQVTVANMLQPMFQSKYSLTKLLSLFCTFLFCNKDLFSSWTLLCNHQQCRWTSSPQTIEICFSSRSYVQRRNIHDYWCKKSMHMGIHPSQDISIGRRSGSWISRSRLFQEL